MKRLLRRMSRSVAAADDDDDTSSFSYSTSAEFRGHLRLKKKLSAAASTGVGGVGHHAGVPAGHVPVCVGEEGGPVQRFAVRAELLGDPAFAALLRRAAQEYGYDHPGALRIPCAVPEFRRLLRRISLPDDHAY